jgi:hypothetical protein
MRWKTTLGAFAVVAAMAVPARGDEPKPQYPRRTTLVFGETEVTGEVTRPIQTYVTVRRGARFQSLISLRGDFRPELLRSVDNL